MHDRLTSLIKNGVIGRLFASLYASFGKAIRESLFIGTFLDRANMRKLYGGSLLSYYLTGSVGSKRALLRAKIKTAQKSEQSVLVGVFENAGMRFFSSSLRSLGVFFLSFGLFVIFTGLFTGFERFIHLRFTDSVLFGAILVLIGLIMMPFPRKTVASALHASKILSRLFFDVFTIKQVRLAEKSKARSESEWFLLAGLLCGVVSYVDSPKTALFFLFLAVCTYLIFSMPENGVLLICLVYPFFDSRILISLILLTAVSTVYKIIRGKRAWSFPAENLLFLFLAVLVLTATPFLSHQPSAVFRGLGFAVALVFGMLTVFLIASSAFAEKCFRMLCYSALLTAFYGLYGYLTALLFGDNPATLDALSPSGALSSCFDSPLTFAAFLIGVIPLVFAASADAGRFFCFSTLLMLGACLILTGSAYAILALAASALIVILIFTPYGLLSALILGGLCFAVFKIVPESGAVLRFLQSLLPYTTTNEDMQTVSAHGASSLFSGLGIGGIDAASTGTLSDLVIAIGLPLALLAVIALLFLLQHPVACVFSQKNVSVKTKRQCSSLLCSLAALFFYGFSVNITADYSILTMLILFIALGNAVPRSARADYIPASLLREELSGR